jgi:hypothetical protein
MHPTKPHPAPGDTCQDTWQRLSRNVQPVTTMEARDDKTTETENLEAYSGRK